MLSLRHSIGNVSPLESLARNSKSVPHFRCYASPPRTETYALIKCMDERVPLGVFKQLTDKTSRSYGSTYHVLGLGLITIDLQKKFRVPLRGERTERLTVARHQSHDLVGHLSKVQQCFVHLCL